MKYEVMAVDDGLPEGVHTLIVERSDEPPLLLIAGHVAEAWRTMRAWEDTIEPAWQPTVTLPLPRPTLAPDYSGWQAMARLTG